MTIRHAMAGKTTFFSMLILARQSVFNSIIAHSTHEKQTSCECRARNSRVVT